MHVKYTTPFISSRLEMLKTLLKARTGNNIIGIWSPALGQGIFLSTIKDILRDEDEEDIVVVLSDCDLTSPRANSYVLYLNEIERIYPFILRPVTQADFH